MYRSDISLKFLLNMFLFEYIYERFVCFLRWLIPSRKKKMQIEMSKDANVVYTNYWNELHD